MYQQHGTVSAKRQRLARARAQEGGCSRKVCFCFVRASSSILATWIKYMENGFWFWWTLFANLRAATYAARRLVSFGGAVTLKFWSVKRRFSLVGSFVSEEGWWFTVFAHVLRSKRSSSRRRGGGGGLWCIASAQVNQKKQVSQRVAHF